MCSACANNATNYYIKQPNSKCGKVVKSALEGNSDSINIELPIINKKADGINLKKIHDEIYKQAQDAYITQNPLTVHPNVNGVDFAISIEEAEELLKEE